MSGNKEITQFQLLFILIHSQIGIGIITLPYEVFLKAGEDSWMSVLLAGIIIQVTIFIMGALMKRFPNSNLFEIIQLLFGKWFGKVIIILYSIYFLIIGGISLAKFAFILKTWIMPLTPKSLLVALMVITAVYAVKESLQIVSRFFFLSTFIILVFIGSAAYALKDANITFIMPVGREGIVPIVQGIAPSFYSFQGFEMLLLVFPFVQRNSKGLIKVATIANVFVTLFYTFLVVATLLFLSPTELRLVPEPILYIIKAFTFKIMERPDLFFTSMWIVLVATSIMAILYASSLSLSKIVNSNKRSNYVFVSAGICFFLAMTIQGRYEITSVSNMFNPFIFPFAIGLPILFLLISIIFNKKESENG